MKDTPPRQVAPPLHLQNRYGSLVGNGPSGGAPLHTDSLGSTPYGVRLTPADGRVFRRRVRRGQLYRRLPHPPRVGKISLLGFYYYRHPLCRNGTISVANKITNHK